MKWICWLAAIVIGVVSNATAAPKGTVPRSSAERYAVHGSQNGVGIGLVALTSEQARKQFVSDVNRCCVVVEIALYPGQGKALDVSLNDIVLRVDGKEMGAKPASPKVVASMLQKKAASTKDITVSPSVGVGYGTGYDPVTGRSGGVYEQVGVGVGIGGGPPPSGSTEKDRSVMETELSEKGLPEGSASAPVAGFVYFPVTPKKKAKLQLEYFVQGKRISLNLPQL